MTFSPKSPPSLFDQLFSIPFSHRILLSLSLLRSCLQALTHRHMHSTALMVFKWIYSKLMMWRSSDALFFFRRCFTAPFISKPHHDLIQFDDDSLWNDSKNHEILNFTMNRLNLKIDFNLIQGILNSLIQFSLNQISWKCFKFSCSPKFHSDSVMIL